MNWMTSHITVGHVSRDASLFFGNRMGEASFEMMLHWTPLSMTWWTHYVMNSNRQKKIFFQSKDGRLRHFILYHWMTITSAKMNWRGMELYFQRPLTVGNCFRPFQRPLIVGNCFQPFHQRSNDGTCTLHRRM